MTLHIYFWINKHLSKHKSARLDAIDWSAFDHCLDDQDSNRFVLESMFVWLFHEMTHSCEWLRKVGHLIMKSCFKTVGLSNEQFHSNKVQVWRFSLKAITSAEISKVHSREIISPQIQGSELWEPILFTLANPMICLMSHRSHAANNILVVCLPLQWGFRWGWLAGWF